MSSIKKYDGMFFEETQINSNEYGYYFYLKYPIIPGDIEDTLVIDNCTVYLSPNGQVVGIDIPLSNSHLEALKKYYDPVTMMCIDLVKDTLRLRLGETVEGTRQWVGKVNIDRDLNSNFIGIEIY